MVGSKFCHKRNKPVQELYLETKSQNLKCNSDSGDKVADLKCCLLITFAVWTQIKANKITCHTVS